MGPKALLESYWLQICGMAGWGMQRAAYAPEQVDRLYAGEVGYLSASIKAVADARVGDTITLKKVLQFHLIAAPRALAACTSMPCCPFGDNQGITRPGAAERKCCSVKQ